ncbi:amyloid fiber anchoring/assembly protein TapA [Virgibacillus siamensis]|uniref:amyloid fiber anchoring/assembly protein TapA n=1 Tax=Virgibacillus siamensis TaxID=480071 RepID=UPI0009859C51|nr:amyloid fiber anchoring/assembly protein TapA [Virgibacillus siamensis]
MRKSRLRKFRNNFKLIVNGSQIFMIWCCLLIAGTYFNTYTNASFNDIEEVTGKIHVDWEQEIEDPPGDGQWDKSSLESLTGSGDYGFSCKNGVFELYSYIKNKNGSEPMAGPSKFEVQYAPDGQKGPNKPHPGEIIFEGVIPALDSGEKAKLVFETDNLQPGKYVFKAYQRPGHPGKSTPWGGKIEITQEEIDACFGTPETESQEKNKTKTTKPVTSDKQDKAKAEKESSKKPASEKKTEKPKVKEETESQKSKTDKQEEQHDSPDTKTDVNETVKPEKEQKESEQTPEKKKNQSVETSKQDEQKDSAKEGDAK